MPTLPEPPTLQCDAKALDWALFVLNIVSTHVTWWLFPLPTLFKRGLRSYIEEIAWESLRLQIPSLIGWKSCLNQDRSHWQMCYYSGVAAPSTRLQTLKAFFKDSLIIVSTILSVYRLCHGGKLEKDLSGLNSSLWSYPSLPVAIIGLCISVFSRTQIRTWILQLLTLTVIATIGAAIAVAIFLTYNHGLWYGSTILLVFTGMPLWAISPRLILHSAALATLMRIGGPIIGAVTPGAYFPFCSLRGWGFSGPLLGLGIISFFLGLYGTGLKPRAQDLPSPPPQADIEMTNK